MALPSASWLAACLLVPLPAVATTESLLTRPDNLASPDGRIVASFQWPGPGTNEPPRWSVAFRGTPLLTGGQLGLETRDGGDWMAGARVVQQQWRSVRERVPVCFDNPSPMVADYPTAYTTQPGFDFLRQVPTWWDETRILVAEVGRLLVTARRKGAVWYLRGMSAGEPRELDLPLTFLPAGRFSARIWQDAPGTGADPNLLENETRTVSVADRFRLRFARDGGFVAELRPAAD